MEPYRLNPQALQVAQMKDQELVRWLEKRLSESGSWAGRSTAFILSSEMLDELMTCFQSLESHAKLKIIMAYAYVNPRYHPAWRESMMNLIGVARRDPDDWVEMISELLRDIPTNSQIQTKTGVEHQIHEKFLQDIEHLVNAHDTAGNLNLNPKSYDMCYVAMQKMIPGLTRESKDHFKIVKRPKSFSLCQDVLKQSEIANSLKKDKSQGIITSSMPLKFRNTRREANMDLPMRGIPTADTVKMSAGFSNEPKKFQRQLSKRDGGVKLLDISDLPTPLKKRRQQQQEEDRKKKIDEKEHQRKKQADEKRLKEEAKRMELLRIQEEKRLEEERQKEEQAKNEQRMAEAIALENKKKAEKEKCIAEMLQNKRQEEKDKEQKRGKSTQAMEEPHEDIKAESALASKPSEGPPDNHTQCTSQVKAIVKEPIARVLKPEDKATTSMNMKVVTTMGGPLPKESKPLTSPTLKPMPQPHILRVNRQVPGSITSEQMHHFKNVPQQSISTEQLQQLQMSRQNEVHLPQRTQEVGVSDHKPAPMLHHPPLSAFQQNAPQPKAFPRTNLVPQQGVNTNRNNSRLAAGLPTHDQSHVFNKNSGTVPKAPIYMDAVVDQSRERHLSQEPQQQAQLAQFSANGNFQFVYANGQPISQEALFRQHEMQVQKQCDSILSTANAMDENGRNMVKQFMLGNRINPRPDLGNVVTLKLSEVIQDDIDSATGQTVRMKIETFFQMDYMNGEWKRLRKCRPFNMTMIYPGNHVY